MKPEDEVLLDDHDWEIVCESPLEIEHKETGDKATGIAVKTILDYYKLVLGVKE